MWPLFLLTNKNATDKALAALGYMSGLGQMDVRELSETRIPVWAVAAVSAAAGVGLGIYIARKLPAEWIVGKRRARE